MVTTDDNVSIESTEQMKLSPIKSIHEERKQ